MTLRRYSGWGEVEKEEPDAFLAEYDSRGTDGNPVKNGKNSTKIKILCISKAGDFFYTVFKMADKPKYEWRKNP